MSAAFIHVPNSLECQVAVEHHFTPCYTENAFLRTLLLACQTAAGSRSSAVSHTSVEVFDLSRVDKLWLAVAVSTPFLGRWPKKTPGSETLGECH